MQAILRLSQVDGRQREAFLFRIQRNLQLKRTREQRREVEMSMSKRFAPAVRLAGVVLLGCSRSACWQPTRGPSTATW